MSFAITHAGIDAAALRDSLQDRTCGAVVMFEGRVRDHNDGRPVRRLEYEVYEPIAVKEGNTIIAEARERWAVGQVVAVHRAGTLDLTDVAVVVGVAAAHRDDAFQAARYIIDELKSRLPIWKKEHYLDGVAQWVNCRHCDAAGHGTAT